MVENEKACQLCSEFYCFIQVKCYIHLYNIVVVGNDKSVLQCSLLFFSRKERENAVKKTTNL